jgi:hypothetical protein
MRYRKKPVVIEAVQYDGASTSVAAIQHWMEHGVFRQPKVVTNDIRSMYISTLEGEMTANPGDWIIKGVQGEFYPCRPHIFAATYEAVKEEEGSD